MKIILTGSFGHLGKPLTKELVQNGHAVTVISRSPERQKEIEALGATATIGLLEDVSFLMTAFTGADAVYTMVPPADYFDKKLDLKAGEALSGTIKISVPAMSIVYLVAD
jgi:uncharacterized protein YbjT (DUF2867 family)